MSEFILNIYQLHVAPVGTRGMIKFQVPSLNSIKIVDDELMCLKNRVSNVSVKRGKAWVETTQSLYLHDAKKDVAKGIFYGTVEVGSKGSFHRLRKRNGSEPYVLKADDLSMREYFYRIEMPPDSELGFLVVQRHGRNTASNAMQQALRQRFFKHDHAAYFRLITDADAFNEYLSGRVQAVRATYVPQKTEARDAVKRACVLGSGLSSKQKEDMKIDLKVDRTITQALKQQIEAWLRSGDKTKAPQIVTLPVSDDPDKIVLSVETDSGKQKQLHPGMIEDMALVVDLSAKVKWSAGRLDLSSANNAVAEVCATHRAAMTT